MSGQIFCEFYILVNFGVRLQKIQKRHNKVNFFKIILKVNLKILPTLMRALFAKKYQFWYRPYNLLSLWGTLKGLRPGLKGRVSTIIMFLLFFT